FRPSAAPTPAAINADKTIKPTTIPLLLRETGACGKGVGVDVTVGVTGSVAVEVGIPKVAVASTSTVVGSAVGVAANRIVSVCPSKISSVAKPLMNFNSSMVVSYASAILHKASSFFTIC